MITPPVYMDYHATTPVDPRVVEAMLPFFTERFGNPASRQHQFGWIAEEAVESARSLIARALNCGQREIIFTGGATEGNNLALKGIIESMRQKGNQIITVKTEHKSVLDTCKRLERAGIDVVYLDVDGSGLVDVDELRRKITPKTVLVSVMLANNEIGTLQPIGEIGQICREKGVILHTDATQALGKIPIDVQEMKVDLLSFSGHKIYGPKGVGGLFVRNSNPRVKLSAQLDGGGQERGMRSGTLNVPGIVGLGKAIELAQALMEEESCRLRTLRNKLFDGLRANLDDVYLNGHEALRLPNNLNLSFLHVEDNVLMMSLKDIALSTGSACSTADPEPSHVLKALRLPADRLHSALRFGLGRFTTEEEIGYVIRRVTETVTTLRAHSPRFQAARTPQLS